MNNFYIGKCVICGQGMLECVKEKDSNKLFIICDECEGEWASPNDALNGMNGTRGKYGIVSKCSTNEIKKIGWIKYIIDITT